MDKFIPLAKKYQTEEKNIYLSDGFIPKYSFNNMADEHVVERDRIIIPKRDLRERESRGRLSLKGDSFSLEK